MSNNHSTRYIALLRGINVGGKNKISMPLLKAAFQEAGFSDVVTYINSGNVIFTAGDADEASLKSLCETIILDHFGLDIPVMVISASDLAKALENAPSWWDSDGDLKHNAIFVIPPASADEISDMIGETNPEYEKAHTFAPVIFWSAPLATFSKTRWAKMFATNLRENVTIRNANTAKKLLSLTESN